MKEKKIEKEHKGIKTNKHANKQRKVYNRIFNV